MCDPVSAVVGAIALVGGYEAIKANEGRKADAAIDAANRGRQAYEADQAKRQAELTASTANRPKRADAAEALYGNPMKAMQAVASGGEAGTPSTGISTQVNAAPTALTLGKSDLLGQ